MTFLVMLELQAAHLPDRTTLPGRSRSVAASGDQPPLDRKITSLVAAVESGAEIAGLTDRLSKRGAERELSTALQDWSFPALEL